MPTRFYQWQRTFFENGAAAFTKTASPSATNQPEQRITKLEAKLQQDLVLLLNSSRQHAVINDLVDPNSVTLARALSDGSLPHV